MATAEANEVEDDGGSLELRGVPIARWGLGASSGKGRERNCTTAAVAVAATATAAAEELVRVK